MLVENVWSGDSRWNASLRITRGTVISNRSAFKGKTISIEFTVPGKGGWLQYYSEKKNTGGLLEGCVRLPHSRIVEYIHNHTVSINRTK